MRVALKGIVQQGLGLFGYQLQRRPAEGSLEREWQRVIDDRQIVTVLDIGAHVGLFATRLRSLGFDGRIISFEPSARPFRELKAKTGGAWQALQVALGDEDGTADLHVYAEHEEFTSLRLPSDYGREHFGLTRIETLPVPVQRLDEVAARLGVDARRTFVKIDTQGHDDAVITGGAGFLNQAAALQVEVPMFGLYEGAPSGTAMIERVRSMGFDLVGLFPVHEHPRPLVPVEFDGLFARGAAAG